MVVYMDTMELLKKARAGDREARNQLVEENMKLVGSIVKRFQGRGYDSEDIFQIGCIGLIKAIDHFDLQYQVKFSTYAVPMIAGQIKRFLRDDGMIKVSRTLKEQGWKINYAKEKLHHRLGRTATVEELAKETELDPEEIIMAMEANREVDTIDKCYVMEEGKDVAMVEQVVKTREHGIGWLAGSRKSVRIYGQDTEKEEVLDRMLLKQLLQSLGKRERKIIESRYFHNMTQKQVAQMLQISQVQVSRLEKKSLLQMRKEAHLQG